MHLYRQLCLIISSLTCSALGCLMNMWTYMPPARWAHGLLWWPRTAITNVVSCLVKRLSLFLYCLSEIKFTTTTREWMIGWVVGIPVRAVTNSKTITENNEYIKRNDIVNKKCLICNKSCNKMPVFNGNANHGYIRHYDTLIRQGGHICNSATRLIMVEKLQRHDVKRQNA